MKLTSTFQGFWIERTAEFEPLKILMNVEKSNETGNTAD